MPTQCIQTLVTIGGVALDISVGPAEVLAAPDLSFGTTFNKAITASRSHPTTVLASDSVHPEKTGITREDVATRRVRAFGRITGPTCLLPSSMSGNGARITDEGTTSASRANGHLQRKGRSDPPRRADRRQGRPTPLPCDTSLPDTARRALRPALPPAEAHRKRRVLRRLSRPKPI